MSSHGVFSSPPPPEHTVIDLTKNKVQYATLCTKEEYETHKQLTTHTELMKMAEHKALKTLKDHQKRTEEEVKRILEPVDDFDMRTFMAEYDAASTEDMRKVKLLYLINQNVRLIERHKSDALKYKELEAKIVSLTDDIETEQEDSKNYIEELDTQDKTIKELKSKTEQQLQLIKKKDERFHTLTQKHESSMLEAHNIIARLIESEFRLDQANVRKRRYIAFLCFMNTLIVGFYYYTFYYLG